MAIPSWKTEFKQVTQDVYAYTQLGGPGIDNNSMSNAGCVVGADGILVVDALQGPIPANNFITEIRKVSKLPFKQLVNTHWHGDHTYGNQYFMPTEVIGTEKCREQVIRVGVPAKTWMPSSGVAVGGEPRIVTPPTTTIAPGVMTLYYKDMGIELHGFDPAHTAGDVVVYIPERKVLIAGDLCFFYVTPLFSNGTSAGALKIIEWMESLDVDFIIPGHGPVGTKKDLAINKNYITLLQNQARERYDAGIDAAEAAASMDIGEYAEWPNARERLLNNVIRLYLEFQLKPYDNYPQDERAKLLQEYQAKVGKYTVAF